MAESAAENVAPDQKVSAPVLPTKPVDLEEDPNNSPVGVYAPFPYSPEPFVQLSAEGRGAILTLDSLITKSDVAARRFEVEQAWEAIMFDRGYQHLLRGRNGGWILPTSGSGYGAQQQQYQGSLYDTNVYGSKADIIVAALSREIPKQEFFPVNPKWGPDIVAAEEAGRFKDIWIRNNNLHAILVDVARIFWNEDRACLWTYYELNGQEYGFEGETDTPTVPEDILTPPDEESTGQEGLEDFLAQITSVDEPGQSALENEEGDTTTAEIVEEVAKTKKPLGREVTKAFGKLAHKVPIGVQMQKDMQWIQVFVDMDVTTAKAMFPWIADKIKPGGDATMEAELDRIARENTSQSIVGAYVTGDSMARRTTVKFSWMRPSFFFDEKISDSARAELLEAFPNGCLLAKAGAEYAFSRNESMDDHVVVGHALSGKGQNRRSLGESLISIQKRINDWCDLLDDFFKRTVPKKWMNSDAFDLEAIKKQPNVPGSIGPFLPQPGLTTADQYMMIEPSPTPQPALPDFIKWFITSLSEEISGALPSLFGAPTNTDTFGGIEIQRDQALQRIGCPWSNIEDMFAASALQAVNCARECREEKTISQNIPKLGNVSVSMDNLREGRVQCYPETSSAFPESWAERETRLTMMIDASTQNPMLAQWLFSTENLPALADGLRMKQFKIPGLDSVNKQKAEFELLLREATQDNPLFLQVRNTFAQAVEGVKQMNQAGQMIPPEVQAKVNQLEAAIKTLPPKVSSIQVPQDESENHAVEAATCFEWMNSAEGRKFKNGTPQQRAAYENVHLHWQEHNTMAKKIAAANAPPGKPPSESISAAVDKVPSSVAIQLLDKMGVKATPQDFAEHQKEQLNQKIAGKVVPDAIRGQQ